MTWSDAARRAAIETRRLRREAHNVSGSFAEARAALMAGHSPVRQAQMKSSATKRLSKFALEPVKKWNRRLDITAHRAIRVGNRNRPLGD